MEARSQSEGNPSIAQYQIHPITHILVSLYSHSSSTTCFQCFSGPELHGSSTNEYARVNCSFSLPIGSSWDPSTVRLNAIPKPSMPPYNFQSLFYNNTRNNINNFGGELSYLVSEFPDLSIWKLAIDGIGGGSWTKNSSSHSTPFSMGMTRPFGGAMTVNNDSAFYLDGYSSKDSSPEIRDLNGFVPIPGLVEFEFSSGSWSNDTDTRQLTLSGTFTWGALEAVPFGPN